MALEAVSTVDINVVITISPLLFMPEPFNYDKNAEQIIRLF